MGSTFPGLVINFTTFKRYRKCGTFNICCRRLAKCSSSNNSHSRWFGSLAHIKFTHISSRLLLSCRVKSVSHNNCGIVSCKLDVKCIWQRWKILTQFPDGIVTIGGEKRRQWLKDCTEKKKTVVIDKLIANKRKFGDAFSFKLSPLNTKELKQKQTTALCFVQGICSLNNQFFYSFRCHTKITAASIKKKPKSAWFVTHCKVQKKK